MHARVKNYWGPIKGLGGWALVAFVIGLVFDPLSRVLLSEEVRREVIVRAIPFVASFAGILLLFILGIALIAMRLHLSIPFRTHRAVEVTIIAGIIAGIAFLFQPWFQVAYRHGFGFLLYATLAFIVWSHVVPRSPKEDQVMPAFTARATAAGLVAAAALGALIFGGLALNFQPQEPYGMRQRRWNLLDEGQKAEVVAAARAEYRSVHLPFYGVYSLLPALAVFFVVREVAARDARKKP